MDIQGVMSFDYYSVASGSEFLEQVKDREIVCEWEIPFRWRIRVEKYGYGIRAKVKSILSGVKKFSEFFCEGRVDLGYLRSLNKRVLDGRIFVHPKTLIVY
jgi:hypothetical protein